LSSKPRKPKTTNNRRSTVINNPTNVYDVLIHFLNLLYSLIKSGHLVGLIVTIVFLCYGIAVVKMDSADASGIIKGLTDVLMNERFYVFPLLCVIILQIVICSFQRKVYKAEITRLKDIRNKLVHGFENGELQPLQKHYKTQFDFEQEG
jgi:hypothetical protein